MSQFNINDHFKPHGDEYLVSLAGTLSMCGDALHSRDTSIAGKERARRVVNEVLAVGREKKFPQIDVLETMLLRPSNARRRLMVCDRFIKHVGDKAFMDALGRAGFNLRQGDQA